MAETSIVAGREAERYYPYTGMFYANRHSFWAAGQDSFTLPPAQDQDAFIQLTNVEPVLQGVLQRRRGVQLFSNAFQGQLGTHLIPHSNPPFLFSFPFRSDGLGLHEIVWSRFGAGTAFGPVATDEIGNVLLNPIFNESSDAKFAPRMVISRDYGFFTDGSATDLLKWDGTTTSKAVTNWGTDINNIGSLIFGPQDATVAQDLGAGGSGTQQGPNNTGLSVDAGGGGVAWTNASGPGSGSTATATLAGTATNSHVLQFTNFGFSVPVSATITGISVTTSRMASTAGELFTNSLKILQAGTPVGTDHAPNVFWGNSFQNEGAGASTDLWGVTWTPAQINASNFGFQVQVTQDTTGSATASIQAFPTITVFYTAPTSGSWTNPNGAFQNNPVSPATALATNTTSSALLLTGFGFSVPVARVVAGIKATFTCQVSTGTVTLTASLVKNGLPTGTPKTLSITATTFTASNTGSATDLWSATLLPADVNASNFGVQITVASTTGTPTFSIDRVQLTTITTAGPLTFTTNNITTNIVLLNGRTYFYAFQNSKTLTTSTLSPPSLTTGPLPGSQVNISNIPTSADPQVDTVLLLATADGNDETTLFLVASLPNGTSSFNDTMPDSLSATFTTGLTLLTQPLYQDTDLLGNLHGLANNLQPPAGLNFPVKHKGRIYGAINHTLYFSKNLDDVTTANGLITSRFEEAWPAENQFDISEKAETIQGLLSDGETLWIATERTFKRLIGDSPSNFQLPETEFNEVGLYNQETWKVTFWEGTPIGTMWLTKDFKVMASDFNTYQDVGKPIQDVLNSISTALGTYGQTPSVFASYVSQGPADYYMLYLPTTAGLPGQGADTICVFDLRRKKWHIWKPTIGQFNVIETPTTSLFLIDQFGTPRWFFSGFAVDSFGNQGSLLNEWKQGLLQDKGFSYPVTIQTSWLDMGDYGLRKFLNQIIPTTADNAALTVQVEAASNEQDFSNPTTVVPATTVIPAAIPDDVFVPLASGPSHHRAFRLTFVSPASTIQNVLTSYSIEAGVFHRY